MRIIYITMITALLGLSCISNTTEKKQIDQKEMTKKESVIINYYKKLNNTSEDKYYFDTPEELAIYYDLINEDLKKKNYIFPKVNDFNHVIDEITFYNNTKNPLVIEKESTITYLSAKYFELKTIDDIYNKKNTEALSSDQLEISSIYNIVFNKQYRFITYMIMGLQSVSQIKNNEIVIEVPSFVEHLNKYLFNDKKSSLTWLKINKPEVLNGLFYEYGYTADKRLDKWILDKGADNDATDIDHDPYDFGKLFYHKGFDNTAKLNTEVFEVFEQEPSSFYMDQLGFLFAKLGSSIPYDFAEDLSFEQRAELLAKLMYYAEDVAETNKDIKIERRDYPYYPSCLGDYKGIFMEGFKKNKPESTKYYDEFKRNNFYNLSNFEYYWERNEGFSQAILLFR